MSLTIPVAHDFICPWCWVGYLQARRLQREFGAKLEWRGYELFPDELEWPESSPAVEPPANRPPTLTRFEFLLAAEGMTLPSAERPHRMRTHNAHEAVEYAKRHGNVEGLLDRLYPAYWQQGLAINDPEVLRTLAHGVVDDVDAMLESIAKREFAAEIVGYDDPAYATGVYNVPTFFIGDERLAERPYSQIAAAVARLAPAENSIYTDLDFGPVPPDRPYTVINMVTTIDGKIVTGVSGEDVSDLGSPVDHMLMGRIEHACDAVMVGAQTLRAGDWNPPCRVRVVVTRSGQVDGTSRFLQNGEAYVATNGVSQFDLPPGPSVLRTGGDELDFPALFRILREKGVRRMNLLGGSDLNGAILRHDLVDELFLTIAPKMKLGKDVPTYAGGDPLPRDLVQRYDLVENHRVGDEVFLRYRRRSGGE